MTKSRMRTMVSLIVSVALLLLLFGCQTTATIDDLSAEDITGTSVATETKTTVKVTTTTTKVTTTKPKTTATKPKTTAAQTKKTQEDVSGPEYKGYRLVRDAVNKIQNKKYFKIIFTGDYQSYQGGQWVCLNEYVGHGQFAPGSPLSVQREMTMSTQVGNRMLTVDLWQKNNQAFYTYIHTSWGDRAKNRFITNTLTENLALADAVAGELRQLPSAKNAINAKIETNTKYAMGVNQSVTIPVSGEEFSKLYNNCIGFFALVNLKPDATLKYKVREGEVKYIITPDGYLYDTELRYYLEVTGTENGKPYQDTFWVYHSMRLDNYKEDTPLKSEWQASVSNEYETIDNPGWIYYPVLPWYE